MPGRLGGVALAREVRRRRPGLPVILVTGHPGDHSEEAMRDAMAGGRFVVIRKPVSAAVLGTAITRLGAGADPADGDGSPSSKTIDDVRTADIRARTTRSPPGGPNIGG